MEIEKYVQNLLTNMHEPNIKIGNKIYKNINSPKYGDTVIYIDKLGNAQKVKIVSGYYLDPTYHRLSNFWYWVDDKGNQNHGYGNFYIEVE